MQNHKFLLSLFLVVIVGLLANEKAQAYPEFISYGYASCLTCHNNGLGGGPLNDYGRALWSAEIASRWFYPKSMSDEDIGNQSGFLGSVPLPYWIRPDIKYRGLDLVQNVRTHDQTPKYYQMQADFGLTTQDAVGKYLATITFGNIPSPQQYGSGRAGLYRMLAREYYVRIEALKSWWVYAGLIDKVYGLRTVDHTSFQRTYQGFNVKNNSTDGVSQSQSIIVHKTAEKWELALDAFFGNPNDASQYKQKGFSGMTEVEVGENKRLGASIFSGKSDVLKKNMAAIHYRQQVSKGTSFLFEYGFIQNTSYSPSAPPDQETGSYAFAESQVLLTRGYFWKTNVERYNQAFKGDVPDQWRWSTGFLVFPAPRFELRAELMNSREFVNTSAQDDNWAFVGQVHVSL
jgi:hypothetical protein